VTSAAAAHPATGNYLRGLHLDIDKFITEEDKIAIKESVRLAESRTSGEIKVLVVGSCQKPWPFISAQKAIYRRALKEFSAMRIGKTADHTGILIMLSLKERKVQILADKNINDKVTQETWDKAVEIIVNNIKQNNQAQGIIQAIEYVGNVLAQHFPRKENDTNEISDEIEIKP
jgi:uncharacterized membrane protein